MSRRGRARPGLIRCCGLALLWVLAVLGAAAGPWASLSPARATGVASVTPGGGDMRTAYTFAIEGLPPQHGVLIVVYDGAGTRFSYQQDGVEQVVVMDDNGAAAITVTPTGDLPGSVPGTWSVVFTEQETGNSATLQFEVSQ